MGCIGWPLPHRAFANVAFCSGWAGKGERLLSDRTCSYIMKLCFGCKALVCLHDTIPRYVHELVTHTSARLWITMPFFPRTSCVPQLNSRYEVDETPIPVAHLWRHKSLATSFPNAGPFFHRANLPILEARTSGGTRTGNELSEGRFYFCWGVAVYNATRKLRM